MELVDFNWTSQGLEVKFHDLSIPYQGDDGGFTSIVSWRWAFGDYATSSLSSSNERNPIHEYAIPGNYSVTLWVTDNLGTEQSAGHLVGVGNEKKSSSGSILSLSPILAVLFLLALIAGFVIAGLAAKSMGVRLIMFMTAMVVFFIFMAIFPREWFMSALYLQQLSLLRSQNGGKCENNPGGSI